MHRLIVAADKHAVAIADRLMTETHAKNRNFSAETHDQFRAHPRLLRRAGPGRNDKMRGLECLGFVGGDAIVADDLHAKAAFDLAEPLHEVKREGVVVVDQEKHSRMVRARAKRVSSRAMTTEPANERALCTARLEESTSAKIVVSIPGTEYTLTLVPAGTTTVAPGKRLAGTITGRAQKFHRAQAGGEFIEPVEGHPRIVQGRVRESDPARNRVLLQAVVPMWVTLCAEQSAKEFSAGDFVNFYMESGVTFAPHA